MEDAITQSIRTMIQEELRAALQQRVVPSVRSEQPLHPGEIERQYSVKAAADLLGVSVYYIYDRIEDGSLPRRVDLGGTRAKYRIPASDLQRFIDERTVSVQA